MTYTNPLDVSIDSCSPKHKAETSCNEQNQPSRQGAQSPGCAQTDGALTAAEGEHHVPPNLRISDLKTVDKTAEQTRQDRIRNQETKTRHEGTNKASRGKTGEDVFYDENAAVYQYFLDHVPVALELQELREKGWISTEGHEFFKKQKWHTDNADRDTSRHFMNMMRTVARQMEAVTGVFTLSGRRPTILALGFAPGGFVEKALSLNPNAQAIGITLSDKLCGMPILVKDRRLTFHPADITLMAADMGMLPDEIPPKHPDASRFLPKLIRPRAMFDLVTAEGGVLRPHQTLLGPHREHHETHRLLVSQLALALSRVKQGGSMIVLLHKPETWKNVRLFHTFNEFARIQLFKPSHEDGHAPHQYKSSFYMIARDIQSQSEAASMAVKQWIKEWKTSTFGSEEEYREVVHEPGPHVGQVLGEWGQEWINLSRRVWEIQRDGLKAKSFTKDEKML